MTRDQPVLAILSPPGGTDQLRALTAALASHVEVRALDEVDGRPDAVLAASVEELDGAPAGVPVAVWVTDPGELEAAGLEAGRARPTQR